MKYRVHRFDIRMTRNPIQFESFLNGIAGEIVAVIPNVTISFFWVPRVDFLLVVEKIA